MTIDLSQANLPAGTAAYAYIVGGNLTTPQSEAATLKSITNYRLDAAGGVHQLATSDNTIPKNTFPGSSQLTPADQATIEATYPSAWADYSIPLSLTAPTVIDLSGINPTNMPGLGPAYNAFSGRVYISIGVPKLPFSVQAAVTTGTAQSPNPYAGPSIIAGTPGALCLFDWFEFSLDSNGILNGNPTNVDQFGFPLTINVAPGGSPQGALNLTRAKLMSAIANFSAPFDVLQPVAVTAPSAYPAGINYLRAFSPDHLSTAGGGDTAFQTYFDSVIAHWNTTLTSTPMIVTDTATGTYSGMSVSGNWIFIQGNFATASQWQNAYNTNPASAINFGAITTAMIWQCSGTLASGSAAQSNIGKQILAAFNRGVMSSSLDDGNCPVATAFYPVGVPSNLWAYQFHQWNTNGLAYGFAYDDVCSQNPSEQTSAALTSASITLGPML